MVTGSSYLENNLDFYTVTGIKRVKNVQPSLILALTGQQGHALYRAFTVLYIQETNIPSFCLGHQSQKAKTRRVSVMWFHHIPKIGISTRPRQNPLLFSRALSRCLQTSHLLCCSFLLPGMAFPPPSRISPRPNLWLPPEWSPLWPGQSTQGLPGIWRAAAFALNNPATGYMFKALFLVMSLVCTIMKSTRTG